MILRAAAARLSMGRHDAAALFASREIFAERSLDAFTAILRPTASSLLTVDSPHPRLRRLDCFRFQLVGVRKMIDRLADSLIDQAT